MKTNPNTEPTTATVFPRTVALALTNLKQQLQRDYEQAYPDLREIVHLVLDEEESRAWDLTLFPHLLLPDLVEAHIARLNLKPAETRHDDIFASHYFNKIDPPSPGYSESFRERDGAASTDQPAFALCG